MEFKKNSKRKHALLQMPSTQTTYFKLVRFMPSDGNKGASGKKGNFEGVDQEVRPGFLWGLKVRRDSARAG